METNITTNADKIYVGPVGGSLELVAEDQQFSLPEVAPLTTTVNAMGDFDVPVIGQIGDMEGSIHFQGVSKSVVSALAFKTLNMEIRWVQQIFDEDGTTDVVGCKAILTILPKVHAPAIEGEKGSVPDLEVKFGITKYQLFCDGVELWNIDRLNHILRIGGVDYYQNLSSLL